MSVGIISRFEILKEKNKGVHEKIKEKARKQLKKQDNHTIPKMPTSNQSLLPEGMAQSTLAKYYPVVLNPSETKIRKKHWKIEEEIILSDVTNDSNNNDNSTTHTT